MSISGWPVPVTGRIGGQDRQTITSTDGDATAHSLTEEPRAAVPRRPRLVGLDAARGLAIIGMIIVNVGPTDTETVLQRLYLLPFGRASILFVVLAGVGMGLFLRRRRGRRALWVPLVWRVLLLVVLGLVLQTMTRSVSVILTNYALLFLLAPLLWRLSTRWLVGFGLVLMVAGPALIVAYDVQSPGIHAPEGVSLTTPPAEAVASLLLTGPYPLASWTVPFAFGLALSRLDLASPVVLRRMTVWGGVAAVLAFLVADLAYAVLGTRADEGWLRLLTGVGHGQMPLWLISATGGAVLTIALGTWLGRRAEQWIRPLAVLGAYALTTYVLHVLVLAVIKPDEGLGSFAEGAVITIVLTAVLFLGSLLWDRTGRLGPLEWMLRNPWLRPAPPVDPSPEPSQEEPR